MAAGRETGAADRPDHLSSTDPLTGPDQVAGGVIEGRLDLHSGNATVAEEQPIPVRGAVVASA